MANFADIQGAITKLGTDITNEIDAVIAKLTPVEGQVTVEQADIDAAVTSLGALSATVQAETASLGGTTAS